MLRKNVPVHVTLHIVKDVPSLREPPCLLAVEYALQTASQREGFRLVHFCVMGSHLHLICEATDWRHLSSGVPTS